MIEEHGSCSSPRPGGSEDVVANTDQDAPSHPTDRVVGRPFGQACRHSRLGGRKVEVQCQVSQSAHSGMATQDARTK